MSAGWDPAARKLPKEDAIMAVVVVAGAGSRLACSRGANLVEAILVRLRGSGGRAPHGALQSEACASLWYQ